MELVLNLSKNKKWPTISQRCNNVHNSMLNTSDFYFTYDLTKQELGKYLNTWYVGNIIKSKTGSDEIITLKKVDKDTANLLYQRNYNPVSIRIMQSVSSKFNTNGDLLYEMKAMIHSIDDSQYGIWWQNYYNTSLTFNELVEIRTKLMLWVNSKPILNGEEFLDYCVSLGASAESKDYN